MQALQIVLILAIASFGGIRQTVRADGTGTYITIQQCEDNLSKNYAAVGIDTCAVTQEGTYIGSFSVAGQTNVDVNNHPIFIGLPGYKRVTITGSTSVISYTEFEDLSFEQNSNNTVIATSSSIINIKRCFINQTYANNGVVFSSSTVKLYSTSIISAGNCLYSLGSTNLELYNVTGTMLATNQIAFNHQGSSAKAVNSFGNHVGSSIYSAFYNAWTNSDYNASTDASAPGTVKYINVSPSPLKADNSHIAKTSFLYAKGTTVTGNTRDIDNELFRTTPSIGADEPYDSSDSTSGRRCTILWRHGLAPRGR